MPKILADLHVHSTVSLHAYSTLKEIATVAKERELPYVAITDHLYNVDASIISKNNVTAITNVSKICGKPFITGVELNLGQSVDSSSVRELEKRCTWRPIGLHSWFVDVDKFLYFNVLSELNLSLRGSNGHVRPTAFAHPERSVLTCKSLSENEIKLLTHDIVDLAVSNDIFLEINEESVSRYGPGVISDMWLRYAKEKHAKLCLGTDAHYCDVVGVFTGTEQLIESLDLTASNYIINYDENALEHLATGA